MWFWDNIAQNHGLCFGWDIASYEQGKFLQGIKFRVGLKLDTYLIIKLVP